MKFHFQPLQRVYLQILSLMVVGCQSIGPIADFTKEAADAGDKTLIMSGCDGLQKGISVCRVVEGSLIVETFDILIPWHQGVSERARIRIRAGSHVIDDMSVTSTLIKGYRELYGSATWKPEHDGPIQIAVTTNNNDGTSVRALGYIYIIVLHPGYSPEPALEVGKEFSSHKCQIEYDKKARSRVKCDD